MPRFVILSEARDLCSLPAPAKCMGPSRQKRRSRWLGVLRRQHLSRFLAVARRWACRQCGCRRCGFAGFSM